MNIYFGFNGLATRSEYWAVYLISIAAFLAMLFTGAMLFGVGEIRNSVFSNILGILVLLAAVVLPLWATISTTIRRCRDADINPWWTLATVIPYINFIPIIVIGVLPSFNKGKQ